MIAKKELYQFADEPSPEPEYDYQWKILIAHADPLVHEQIKEIWQNFHFEGKSLLFLRAHDDAEIKKMILQNPDLAVIIADDNLPLFKYVRITLNNDRIKFILWLNKTEIETNEYQLFIDYGISS